MEFNTMSTRDVIAWMVLTNERAEEGRIGWKNFVREF